MALHDQLYAYYRLNGSLFDSSGNGRHLTQVVMPVYDAGVLGLGLAGGSARRAAPGGGGLNLNSTKISLTGWLTAKNTGGGSLGAIGWCVDNGPDQELSLLFGIHPHHGSGSIAGIDWHTPFVSTSGSGTADQRHHVAITWDGDTGDVVFYRDGQVVTSNITVPPDFSLDDYSFYIEAESVPAVTSLKDEVGVWVGRVLTQLEIQQLYNGGDGLDPTAGTGLAFGSLSLTPAVSGNLSLAPS